MPDPMQMQLEAFRLDRVPPAWEVRFEPPGDGMATGSIGFLAGSLPIEIPVELFYDTASGTQRQVIWLNSRAMAHLWALVNQCPAEGVDVPVLFRGEGDAEGRLDATVNSGRIRLLLETTEDSVPFGLRTHDLPVPVYLQEFWLTLGRGQIDAVLLHLTQFRLVSEELLDKARRVDAANSWAVLIPQVLPRRDEIVASLRPLIDHRRGEIIDVPEGGDWRWLDSVFLPELANRPAARRPYYLLAVGDLDVFDMDAFQVLEGFGGVGRLALDGPDDYAAYAEKVLCYERHAPVDDGPSVRYVASDLDDINTKNFSSLVEPLRETFRGSLLAHGQATKERVLEVLRDDEPGSVAFVSAHGLEFTDEDEPEVLARQRELQGALLFDDFDGTLGPDLTGIAAACDLEHGPVVPGGTVILHACYSAGTIGAESLPPWVHLPMPPRVRPETPFTSRLAKALLANPEGPVAVYAHVNRSHQYTYYHPAAGEGDTSTRQQYHDMLGELLAGGSIGVGRERARTITLDYMSQAEQTSHQVEIIRTGHCMHGGEGVWSGRKAPVRYENAFLQYSIATYNFRNYCVLGDPAARCAGAVKER